MIHQPVLESVILELFKPDPDSYLLDLTLGTGGHTAGFLEAAGPGAQAVGLDADPAALTTAQQQLARFGKRVTYINANFAHINDAVKGGGIVEREKSSLTSKSPELGQRSPAQRDEVGFTHILFDLGMGSHQLADRERGFSFRAGGPLTMAYGPLTDLPPSQVPAVNHLATYLGQYPDAATIILKLAESDLAQVLRTYGEERYAGRIARALKESPAPLDASGAAQCIAAAVPGDYEQGRIHPATRTFQALRLAVNRELEVLAAALPQAIGLLAPSGKLAIISFHSLEDRIVKNFLRAAPNLMVLTKKPIRPGPEEVEANPRARSAKLRAAQQK